MPLHDYISRALFCGVTVAFCGVGALSTPLLAQAVGPAAPVVATDAPVLPPLSPSQSGAGRAAQSMGAALEALPKEGTNQAWREIAAPSRRPSARPGTSVVEAVPTERPSTASAIAPPPKGWSEVSPIADLRPKARPKVVRLGDEGQAAQAQLAATGLERSLRPMARPKGLAGRGNALPPKEKNPSIATNVTPVAAIRPAPGAGRVSSPKGSVCGIPGLKGQAISPIVGRVQGCGIANPVRITEVDGIRLSQPATIDCSAARALHTWVVKGLRPAMGNTGGGITTIQIAGHYVCRPRNHRKGAKISEHGRGNAVDISGFVFANGQKMSILKDWRGQNGAKIKAAHRAACGTFGTTLGPGSDGMHEDHLHFDVARHRNGAYCR